jgi:hypothetical protein
MNARLIIFLLMWSGAALGQTLHPIQILSPRANEEVCLATSLPIVIAFENTDSITLNFEVKFEIRNLVTNVATYAGNRLAFDLAPGSRDTITFDPYITNPYLISQLGIFQACAILTALDPKDSELYSDTVCERIFGIRTTALPFNEPSDGYSRKASGGDFPDQTKWVSLGATVVDGDTATWDPPPPMYHMDGGIGMDSLFDPVIKIDRRNSDGVLYTGSGVGDTLTSFPFDLQGQTKTILCFDFMRGGKNSYPELWNSGSMIGPEATVADGKGNVLRSGDSLILEFKDSASSACNPERWYRIAAIDGGNDLRFQSFTFKMSGTGGTLMVAGHDLGTVLFPASPYTNGFRFRLRLAASNDGNGKALPADDDDAWYIDNISFQVPRLPDLEMRWAKVITPYTSIPFSAAFALPVYFNLKNTTTDFAIGAPLKVWITAANGDTEYFQKISITSLHGGEDSVVRAPDWNAQQAILSSPSGVYTVHAAIASSSYDNYVQDNETFSTFYLKCDPDPSTTQEFALDDGTNDLPALTHKTGNGLGFENSGGSYAMKFSLASLDTVLGARIFFGSANKTPDPVRISLMSGDANSCVPGTVIASFVDIRRGFDQFWLYNFPGPIELSPGVYWLSVSQLSTNSYALGGDISRGGGAIVVADSLNPVIAPIYSDPYGTQYSPDHNSGDISCAYAVETPAGSGLWSPLMPTRGNWTSGLLDITAPFVGAGTVAPMIRVVMNKPSLRSGVEEIAQVPMLRFEQDKVIVSLAPGSSGEARVVDILGRTFARTLIPNGGEAVFPLPELPKQAFIEIRSANTFKVFKVLH